MFFFCFFLFSLNLCGTQTSKWWDNWAGANYFQCLIWIIWVHQLSPLSYNAGCPQLISGFDHYHLQLINLTGEHHPTRNLQRETSKTTFGMFDVLQYLLHTLHKSYFVFKRVVCFFNLSWNIKHDMLKMLLFIFHLKQQNTTKKFTNFAKIFFKIHTDMTAMVIQSN